LVMEGRLRRRDAAVRMRGHCVYLGAPFLKGGITQRAWVERVLRETVLRRSFKERKLRAGRRGQCIAGGGQRGVLNLVGVLNWGCHVTRGNRSDYLPRDLGFGKEKPGRHTSPWWGVRFIDQKKEAKGRKKKLRKDDQTGGKDKKRSGGGPGRGNKMK